MEAQSVPPWPVIEIAIEPKSNADEDKLHAALAQMTAEDSSLQMSFDPESRQMILGGTDEYHFDTKIALLRDSYGIDINFGAPQVAYRETITKRVEKDFTHRKLTSDGGQFARVKFIFEPNGREAGNVFESKAPSNAVPLKYIPGVEKGIESGILAGFPLIDTKATLIDGAYHETDSTELVFEIASRFAFREALKDASALLEPIMSVEVVAPEIYAAAVKSDLNMRGRLQGANTRDVVAIFNAEVPLANMFGYLNQLRSFTQGTGTFTMQFKEYRMIRKPEPPLPPAVAMRA